jgi:hypothetical protein
MVPPCWRVCDAVPMGKFVWAAGIGAVVVGVWRGVIRWIESIDVPGARQPRPKR